mmetsp:Transcript_28141/g.71741  ORF Transcript_28141/g.71741 Transcript_28141/m.71741 type:complete len:83 (-) Transcript_28141:326-574(-)
MNGRSSKKKPSRSAKNSKSSFLLSPTFAPQALEIASILSPFPSSLSETVGNGVHHKYYHTLFPVLTTTSALSHRMSAISDSP